MFFELLLQLVLRRIILPIIEAYLAEECLGERPLGLRVVSLQTVHLSRSAWTHLEDAVLGVGHADAALVLHDSTRVIPDFIVRRLTLLRRYLSLRLIFGPF